MKRKTGVNLFVVIAVVAILTLIALNGLKIGSLDIPGATGDSIRKGIDIRGGVSAILVPDYKPSEYDESNLDKDLQTAKTIIEKRLDVKRVFDRNITIDSINKRIIVDIPWAKGETNFDPQSMINELGKTALLTFQEVDENKKDEFGDYLPTGKIVLQGNQVKDAYAKTDPQTGQWVVALDLYKEGADAFAEATGRLVGKRIAIFMDDHLISAPVVKSKITGGQAIITGQKDAVEAGDLARTIRSGSLPFRLKATKIDSISPLLGEGAMNVAVAALIISFIIVCIYMILYYRLPGLLADIALLGLVVLTLLFISWLGIPLTLPGIGGIILSIGMGVDANIIIFERIKEELKAGKTLKASIDIGFKRAFTAVLDANVTTLITAVVLYYMGSGPIQGFAMTLGLGVALSFLTAVTASRIMLQSVATAEFAKNKWLYGVNAVKENI